MGIPNMPLESEGYFRDCNSTKQKEFTMRKIRPAPKLELWIENFHPSYASNISLASKTNFIRAFFLSIPLVNRNTAK